jgi:hypothetical protein
MSTSATAVRTVKSGNGSRANSSVTCAIKRLTLVEELRDKAHCANFGLARTYDFALDKRVSVIPWRIIWSFFDLETSSLFPSILANANCSDTQYDSEGIVQDFPS